MTNKHKTVKKPSDATVTSTCSTSTSNDKKRVLGTIDEKKPIQLRVQAFQHVENVLRDDVAIACKPFGFRPRRSVLPFLRVVRKMRLNVNAVLNDALVFYFDAYAKDGDLRDDVRLAQLCKEEQRLIQLNKLMLRSGAYLDSYADKVLKGGDREDAKLGRKPLAALSKDEEPIFRRMAARREAIVREILEILDRQLPEREYVLKDERPVKRLRSRCRDGNKPFGMGGA